MVPQPHEAMKKAFSMTLADISKSSQDFVHRCAFDSSGSLKIPQKEKIPTAVFSAAIAAATAAAIAAAAAAAARPRRGRGAAAAPPRTIAKSPRVVES